MPDHNTMDHSNSQHHMDHSHMDHAGMDHGDMGGMHAGQMEHMGNLKQMFWISLIFAIPIFILSPFMGIDLPFQFQFPGSNWIILILSTILFFYGGRPFFSVAKSELAEKKPAMMTLISMGISVAYIYSLYAFIVNTFTNHTPKIMDFFWELASLIVIMLLGHWIEMKSTMAAGDALSKLASLVPDTVHLIQGNHTIEENISTIQPRNIIMVKAGEAIPLDGQVLSGTSYVNEALITGESKAIEKKIDSKVVGGSINGDGTLTIKVTKASKDGYLSQISKLVQEAQNSKSKSQKLADKVSGWLFYAAIIIGIIAFVYWLINKDLSFALERLVTVLIIACPHALGLAIPLVMARSTGIAATKGLIIRNNQAIENSRHIDYVLMDKTGTLTEGVFQVAKVKSFSSDYSDNQILQLMGGLEQKSNHPIAGTIVEKATTEKLALPDFTNVTALKGYGIKGENKEKTYYLVNNKYLIENSIPFPKATVQDYLDEGDTISYLIYSNTAIGFVALGDKVKPHSLQFIQELKERNITPVMLTGDNREAASVVAAKLGIDEFQYELLPEDKNKIVKKLEAKGHKVLMIGDGINDAPSLAAATVGVAIGAGTDIAIESADVVLYNSDPLDVIKFLDLAKKTYRKLVENLWWGAGYNIIALPLAAGLLSGIGITLSPAVGAIIMSLSTVIVALNAMSLK